MHGHSLGGTRAVLFDMDGVLVDNAAWHAAAWADCAASLLGLTVRPDDPRIHGGLNHEILGALVGRPFSVADAREFHDAKERCYRGLARGKLHPVPGLRRYLERLEESSLAVVLVTSADPTNIAFVLDELGMQSRFPLRVSGADVTRGKPAPEAYMKGAAMAGAPTGACLAHEDSLNGVRSAVAAGVRVAALTTTTTRAPLLEAGAAWAVADFEEWLERWGAG